MKRWYILKDQQIVGATETKEEAIEMIRYKQKRETHFIKSEFSIMYGEQEFIKYE